MRSPAVAVVVTLALAAWLGGRSAAIQRTAERHQLLDGILDVHVRDGDVYYEALKLSRSPLDHYVASLDVTPAVYDDWSRDERLAFWLNAYNGLVLRTVIDHYPIKGRAPEYPPDSIRQIAGAFGRRPHRAAGRTVTLDQIEQEILPGFHDPRVYFVLGRGARGSGRLRSEAYAADRLESQLTAMTTEFLTTLDHVAVDRVANELRLSAVIGWHEPEFVGAYAATAGATFAARSPIERAAIALVRPHLYPLEEAFIERNQFSVRYMEFDWTLNDLTGGR
jgi:hypothetical protein